MSTTKRIEGNWTISTTQAGNTYTGNVIIDTHTVKISGNLDVMGNLTYINVTELNIQDPFILLNSSNTGSYAANSGVLVHKTATDFAGIRWSNVANSWQVATTTNTAGDTGDWTDLSVSPGGANTDVQFNDGGAFGGSGNFTFDKATNALTVSNGNITGANLLTGGMVSAVGSIIGGGIGTLGLISAAGNITGGNLNTGGNVTANNFIGNFIGNISGNVNAAGNINEVQFNGAGNALAASADFTFNPGTSLLSVTGNITGGNITASGQANVGTLTVNGGSTFAGNLLPSANITYNLGSDTQRWNDIWLSNSTIYLGNAEISANATSLILSNPLGSETVFSGTNGDISITGNLSTGGTASVTGNITGGNVSTGNLVAAGLITGNSYSGNVPASTNILYVAKNGSDSNNGNINRPFLTIKAALTAATSGTSVHVAPGSYTEANPVTIPANVSLIGNDLRTVSVIPATPASDLFYVKNGSYVWGITIRDYLANGFSYDPATPTQNVFVSPYIQNITSATTTGTAVKIDGNLTSSISTKAMILGFFTIINRGGVGVLMVNSAYSQAVNIYTIACDIGIKVESGSFVTLNGSDNGIGNYGLWADGVGPLQTAGVTVGTSTQGVFVINHSGNARPNVNTVMSIAGDPNFYTIDDIVPIDSVSCTVVIQQVYANTLAGGTAVQFFTRSAIIASAHTFEYVGAGTNPATALPQYGGIPIEANEVLQTNGGVVTFTSTDQKGNFKVGEGFIVNQATGTVEGSDFYRSLFGQMTPFILALSDSS